MNLVGLLSKQLSNSTYLIHDVLDMYRLQYFGFDNGMEISVHELKYKVDVYVIPCLDDIQQLDYIIVARKFLYIELYNNMSSHQGYADQYNFFEVGPIPL